MNRELFEIMKRLSKDDRPRSLAVAECGYGLAMNIGTVSSVDVIDPESIDPTTDR